MKEKSQIEKNAQEKQVALLSTALNEASNAGGHWLNATGKGYPKFYPRGVAVSPFNGLFMALHSDRNGCKTNLFTLTAMPRHEARRYANKSRACRSCSTTGTNTSTATTPRILSAGRLI